MVVNVIILDRARFSVQGFMYTEGGWVLLRKHSIIKSTGDEYKGVA